MTVHVTGETPREIFSNRTTFTRLVIVGDPLRGVTSNLKAISSEPLGVDGRAGTTIFPGIRPAPSTSRTAREVSSMFLRSESLVEVETRLRSVGAYVLAVRV